MEKVDKPLYSISLVVAVVFCLYGNFFGSHLIINGYECNKFEIFLKNIQIERSKDV
jgi:hypothetical protein